MQVEVNQTVSPVLTWKSSQEQRQMVASQIDIDTLSEQKVKQKSEPLTIQTPDSMRYGFDEAVVQSNGQFVSAGPGMAYVIPVEVIELEPVIDSTAMPMLSDRVKRALNGLFRLLQHEARRCFVRVVKVEVRGFSDPEEGTQEVVVSQYVMLPPRGALDYWDKLGVLVEVWAKNLPEELVRTVTEGISIEVRWDNDGMFV
ncbi:hypothetical protein J7J84_07340 [bacterium]|nr:hypothetical protein [bacterium]